ncbi:GntR family transcriptional regulator [Paraburkholderia phosphatilytica]|uniref:GntR family transcriptional regulator n=1 Tax=Paraburkholderia phosphatilytica TaxID=2282883 RepID=UPI000E4ABCA2|nr:GntR family transcriptional regulator [Paraburkholderia phosphatilytica]
MSPAKLIQIAPPPLYEQIKAALRAAVLDGTYPAHSQMPSESELCAMFGVSRITVRQALGDLQKEGLVFRLHGKGTFVSKPKAFQNVSALQGFAEAMTSMGHEIVNRLTRFRTAKADSRVAAKLGLEAEALVTEIQRVRLLNREPVSLESTWLPEAIGKRLANADLATRDIFLILENDCGVPLGHADLAIDAVLADETVAHALSIDEGSPVLRIERLTHDAAGAPIDYEHLYFRGDAFQYRLRIDRQPYATSTRSTQ